MRSLIQWLNDEAIGWLTRDGPRAPAPLCDFKRLRFELRSGDVILVEGRSRVAEVIKTVTQSPWSHSALYIGRLYDISDPDLRTVVEYHYDGNPEEPLVIDSLMGRGTITSPLETYRRDQLRICRPEGLAPDDTQRVIAYAAKHLGWDYDIEAVRAARLRLLPVLSYHQILLPGPQRSGSIPAPALG